jgi:hypothetical protein
MGLSLGKKECLEQIFMVVFKLFVNFNYFQDATE